MVNSDAELVELTTASTAMESEWLVGALKGLGITAVTFGDSLGDEFAMSQKLMGLGGGIRVMVPRGELEQAREALIDIEQERPSPEALEAALTEVGSSNPNPATRTRDESRTSDPGKNLAIVILALATLVLGGISISQHKRLSELERASTPAEAGRHSSRRERRWSDNGELASIYFDRDENGSPDEIWLYDREGTMFAKWFDQNGNGFWELKVGTAPNRTELKRHIDANENGIPELLEYPAVNGVIERWLDRDEDWHYERREFVDAASGELLDAFEDPGLEGYTRVK